MNQELKSAPSRVQDPVKGGKLTFVQSYRRIFPVPNLTWNLPPYGSLLTTAIRPVVSGTPSSSGKKPQEEDRRCTGTELSKSTHGSFSVAFDVERW